MDTDAGAAGEWAAQWGTAEREQVERVAGLVLSADPGITTAIKWRRLTFTVHGNWHHWLCGISVTKRGVSLMFHKGALLADPAGLLVGEGRYGRQLPFAVAARDPQ